MGIFYLAVREVSAAGIWKVVCEGNTKVIKKWAVIEWEVRELDVRDSVQRLIKPYKREKYKTFR